MNEITIIKPDDFHIHLRQGSDLEYYAKESEKQFKRGIIMPNTVPPIVTVNDVNRYRDEILKVTEGFEPLMTFKILPDSDPGIISELKQNKVIAGKYYPAGATTNSEDGITDWKIMKPVLKEMEKHAMVLSIHGEVPDSFLLNRERDFLPILDEIHRTFPKLRIVMEHVSCKESIDYINSAHDHVAGSISLHHLISTIEDVINDTSIKCMPIPKTPEDREAIRFAAFSGNRKFFFGSDSAPHKVEGKIGFNPKSGVYTAPVILPKLAELFYENGVLDKLENFVSVYGARFYKLPLNREHITVIKKPMIVPDEMYGVRPYLAGSEISWSLKN